MTSSTTPSFSLVFALFAAALSLSYSQDFTKGLDLPIQDPNIAEDDPTKGPPIEHGPVGNDPRDEPPPILYGEEIDSQVDKIVYVIDVSGSMGEDNAPYTKADGTIAIGNRIDRAKAELTKSVSSLPKNFQFDMVSYDCGVYLWKNSLVDANDANKATAIAWISALVPLDATATGPATARALGLDRTNLSVVLLTDGMPNCGANDANGHRYMIRAANSQRAVINVFGIAASGSYRQFCQDVAADSGGSYYDVP